ncbi:TIGR02450 family Trp-rich protein [Thalassotalea litorea]|uniref:TIGR02450 family Trp-rich protein n=1 Tax=Thalassotalea litorea TaxID=2020715 RepID=A0A5R9IE40_9GAMM|nr:TIGR02450 family Trp-rich protein [Thalassotalea litorea]TLU61865.1 TIGR02450 family Trp-rich protein [Thalassotalea litorea]
MANQINPKKLLNSKWTKCQIENRQKHFIVVAVDYDEENRVENCQIQAILNGKPFSIDWRELKDQERWLMGWQ